RVLGHLQGTLALFAGGWREKSTGSVEGSGICRRFFCSIRPPSHPLLSLTWRHSLRFGYWHPPCLDRHSGTSAPAASSDVALTTWRV
uniref:Uncharacterized protein n=1 Tax=Chrysemys picta bellii TaxID=8478 RepID=A0A8C3HAD7_CHRPI